MIKCYGCGAILQNRKEKQEGYVEKIEEHTLCKRCFKVRHYNEYQVVEKNNDSYFSILDSISNSKDLVLFVFDLFFLPQEIASIASRIKNPVLFVGTKLDLLPRNTYLKKIEQYLRKEYQMDHLLFISSKRNKHLDELMSKIHQLRKSHKVYVVGYTNAGKSTLLNKLCALYQKRDLEITTSMLPSTTLNTIEIPFDDDVSFIDTPGILEPGNFINYIDPLFLKKVMPRIEIRPRIYQVKERQIFVVDSCFYLEVENTTITFYLSMDLEIKRYYKKIDCDKSWITKEYHMLKKHDLVIQGLGFIRVEKDTTLVLSLKESVLVYTRASYL